MIASTVWNQLVATLKENPTLSKYIKVVFEGARSDIGTDSLPCIMLEPVSDGEVLKEMNNVKDVQMVIDLYGNSTPSMESKTKTIVGDDNYKGVMDIQNDIRAVLQASNHLGGLVLDTRIGTVSYGQSLIVNSKYPSRGFVMPITIMYRQQDGY